MATVVVGRHRTSVRRQLLPGWPLYAMFAAFPLWWLLGLGAFIWPVLAIPMAFHLLASRSTRVPRGFGLWVLFLLWMLASATQLDKATSLYVFVYRFSLYLGATIVFLYVYNAPRQLLSPRRVVGVVVAFFGLVVVGGLLGMVFPGASLNTVTESVLPAGILSNSWIHDLVHLRLAQVQSLAGYGTQAVTRPSAPFAFSNEWGANFALLAPFGVLAAVYTFRGGKRLLARALLLVSIVPLVLTGNRGAWLALVVAVIYAALRLAARGNLRLLVAGFAFMLLVVVALVATPLGGVFQQRASHTDSNNTRLSLYTQAIDGIEQSPILGYGSTRQSTNPNQPDVGTHGQMWLVAFSHGIPAALFFIGWLVLTLVRTRRARSPLGFWCNMVVFISIVMLPYYDLLVSQLYIVMVAAALAWRETEEARAQAPPAFETAQAWG